MVKKLLYTFLLVPLFFLNTWNGYGQDCPSAGESSSVLISTSDTEVCVGENPNFTATPIKGGTNPQYQWRVNGVNNGPKSSVSTFTPSNPTNGSIITVEMTPNCDGASPVLSNGIAITVNPQPSVTTTNTATLCSGASTNISLTASTPSSFSWTIGTITGGITGASAGNGSTINQPLSNPSNSALGTVKYIVTPKSTAGNCEGEPYTITVTVNPKPTVTSANTTTICSGTAPNLALTASTPSTFSWTIGSVTGNISGASAGSGPAINQTLTNPNNSAAGTVEYIVTPTANTGNCTGEPFKITVTVNPKPAVTTANTTTICSGASPNISLAASTSSSFSWTVGSKTGGITGASAGTGSSIDQILTNPGNSNAGTVEYIVTPKANGSNCEGEPYKITVTVNPKPTVTTANTATICSGASPNITLTASTPSSFAWTVGTITGGITGASDGNGATINQTLTNPSNSAAGTVKYIVTPTATTGSCAGAPYSITVTVNAKPAITETTTGERCGTGTVIIGATASAGTLNWYSVQTGGTSLGTGNSFTTPSISSTTTYYVGATSNGCTTSARTPVVATVKTIPTEPTAGSNSPICMNGTINLTANTITGATYAWTGPDGFTSTQQNPTITNLSAAKAGTYSVTATVNGCTSTAGTTSVTITPNVTPSVSITSSSTEICTSTQTGSTPVIFTANPVEGGTNPSFQWKNGTTNVGTNSPTYTANSLANGAQISVVMTSNAACASPVTATSNVITMTGFTTPAAPVFTASSGNVNVSSGICPPALGLVYTVTGGDPNISSYEWELPNGWIIKNGANTNSITVDVTGAAASGGTYNIKASAKNACGNSAQTSFPVKVNNSASVYAGLDASMCKGGSIVLSGESNGYAQRYQWTATPAVGNFSDNKILQPTYTPPATFTGTISLKFVSTKEPGNVNCPVVADEMILTVNAPPAISTQPSATPQTLCPNAAATELSVTASGAGLTYQWYGNTTNSNNGGTAISGATSASYMPVTTTPGTLYYYVVVSGTCASPVKSDVSGVVTVNAPPAITAQPSTTPQTKCLNAAATELSVTATGADPKYQWYSNRTNSNTGGTLLSGANASTYTPLTTAPGTLYYYVTVSGTCTPTVISNVSGSVTVNAPPAITDQPSTTAQTICPNDAVTQLSVTATGAGLTYQWYSNTANSNSGGTTISGATSSTYTPLTTTAGTSYYYVVVSGTCTPPVTSQASGAITVNAPPAITNQPSTTAQTVCLNDPAAELSVTATGAEPTYQWYSNTSNSNTGGTIINGATSDTYTPITTTAGTLYYSVVVSGTCSPAVTSEVSGAVTVNAPPAITTQPSTTQRTLCLNAAATQFSVAATGAGLTYQWYSNTTNSNTGGTSLGAGATSSTYTPITTNSGTLYYYVEVSGTCGSPETSYVSGAITVNEAPAITSQPSTTAQNFCLNDNAAAELSVSATGAGLTYQWYSNTSNSNTGGTSLGAGANSATYTPVTTTAGTLYYYVVVNGTCSPAVTSNVSGAVTVNEPVNIITQPAASQTVCSGFPVSFSVEATGTDPSYQWQFNGVDIPGATSATYEINQAKTIDAGLYKVIVRGTGPCGEENSEEANLVVNESIEITGQPAVAEACEGSSASFTVAANGTGLSYQWRKAGIPISDNATYSGTTSETLTVNNLVLADAGNYDVVISGTEDICSQSISTPANLKVNPNSTISLSSAEGTDNPTLCINTVITPITYAVGGGGTGASITAGALPAGLNEVFNSGVFTISGTPTEAGTFDYTVTTTGNCSNESLSGTISITPSNTITLSSATATTSQELCVNTTLTNITYTTTGATGAAFSGLPEGVDGSWANNTVTISGTPTTAGASSNYLVTLTGGCSEVTATGTIIVKPDNTIVLSSAAGTDSQSVCVGTPLTNITYTTTGATGADFSGLPAGITGSWLNNAVTISGTPTTAGGPSTYTVTLEGGCTTVTTTGTITATPNNTIALSSAADTNALSVCVNTATTNITYATTGATGATVTGLPAGVTGGWANNTVTISGTPTAAGGPSTYTVTLTGGCGAVTTTGTITVRPNNTVALSSATGTNAQSVCINSPLTNITYTTAGATGATFSGLPAGVTGSWTNNTVTISGTPNTATAAGGSTTYTVTLTGGCGAVTTTGTIDVKPNNTITLSSAAGTDAQALCINTPLTNITYNTTGATGANFTGLPSGVTGSWANNVITISGTPTAATAARDPTTYTITSTGGCGTVTTTGTIKVDPKPVGGQLLFEGLNKSTYLVCHNATSGSSRAMVLTGETGTVLRWEQTDTPSNPNSWTPIAFTGKSYSGYSGLTKTTLFRAVIASGSCGISYSKFAVISVIPADIKPDPVESNLDEICIGTTVQLTSELNYSTSTEIAEGGAFNDANPAGWVIDGDPNINFPANGNNTKPNRWSETNDHPFDTRDGSKTFDSGDKKFAIVSGQNLSTVETPVFSTFGLSEATLKFDEAFIMGPNSKMKIELSLDGGNTYTVILRDMPYGLDANDGVYRTNNYSNFSGSNRSIDLSDYVGQPSLKIRFTFDGRNDTQRSIWAVDQIEIPNRPVNIASEWSYTNAQGVLISVKNQQNIPVTPDKIGLNTFKITSYLLTDDGTECRSADPENSETVNVYVFDKYTSTAAASAGTCGQNEFSLNAGLSAQNQPNLSFPTPDGYKAPSWKVQGPAGGSFKNPDGTTVGAINNPNAIFVAPNEGTYVLTWEIERNADGRQVPCPPIVNAATVVVKNCSTLDFDGVDDYVDLVKSYDNGTYSVEAWIRPEAATGTIISGPKFEITMADLPTTVVPNTRWYHIAASNGRLYVDGIDVKGFTLRNGSDRAFIGAKWSPPNATNFFSGWIEEVRIWNGNISQEQIKFLMNQRLQNTTNIGVEIPMPAPGLPYSALAGYYKLLASNILNGGYTPDFATAPVNGKLRNMTTLQENTAPLPYTTSTDNFLWTDEGKEEPWTHGDVWDIPNANGINGDPIEWNIVNTSNYIESGEKNIKVLGLIVESNELDISFPGAAHDEKNSGQSIEVTHYLKINGVLDLTGESQLLQPNGSIVEEASTGYVERDQQGRQSSYNYNYWSAPVSKTGAANNSGFALKDGLFDGTDSAVPGPIDFGGEYHWADGNYTGNLRISSYWLNTYTDFISNTYSKWNHFTETIPVPTAVGYTMKGTSGSASLESLQNYVFKGKPNNGDVTLEITKGNDYLIGNPYPSAMNSEQFILDNLKDSGGNNSMNVFNGTLYFWDHFGGQTHYLQQYIGGYATLNLTGGTEAVSNDERINATGEKSLTRPQKYIPVGQAFYVSTQEVGGIITSGGTIIFQNSQRSFATEQSGDESIFMSQKNNKSVKIAETDKRQKIWLMFHSPTGYHRQLLVGADPNASNEFDIGYDAPLIENNVEDMFWIFNDAKFVIQGVGNFSKDQELPLGIKVAENKKFSIEIDELKNIPDEMDIFLKDSILNVYHDLREGPYESTAEPGTINDRFKIVFKKPEPEKPEEPVDPEIITGDIEIQYLNESHKVLIRNPQLHKINRVYLNNMLGQQVHVYYNIAPQKETRLPVAKFPSGVYIVKLHSEKGIISKKVIFE